MGESFDEFRKSLSYGSRNDLSFKFLSHLSEEAAAEFIQEVLRLLGEAYDTGELEELVRVAFEAQVEAYAPKETSRWTYDHGSFTPLEKPLDRSRLLLVTSSGHFPAGHDPEPLGRKGMTQEEAIRHIEDFLRKAPVLSRIPKDTPVSDLRVRHPGYDIRSTQRDSNVTFPLDRLREAEASGRIGEVAPEAFSFPGLADQQRLLEVMPDWMETVRETEADAALLVPV